MRLGKNYDAELRCCREHIMTTARESGPIYTVTFWERRTVTKWFVTRMAQYPRPRETNGVGTFREKTMPLCQVVCNQKMEDPLQQPNGAGNQEASAVDQNNI